MLYLYHCAANRADVHVCLLMQLSEKDEEVLAYLTDITSEDLEGTVDEDGDEMAGFKLSFHFKPNPFFDHPVLVRNCCNFLPVMSELLRQSINARLRKVY